MPDNVAAGHEKGVFEASGAPPGWDELGTVQTASPIRRVVTSHREPLNSKEGLWSLRDLIPCRLAAGAAFPIQMFLGYLYPSPLGPFLLHPGSLGCQQ